MAGVTQLLKLHGWQPGSIIDIGVEFGTAGLYSVWPDVPICLIEPSPECGPYLAKIADAHPGAAVFNVGASNFNGELKVRKHRSRVNVFIGPDKESWDEISIPVRRVDDMVHEAGLKPPYLYKLDTDSHELEILQGSRKVLADTEVVIIELNMFYHLRGLSSTAVLWQFLHEQGFAFLDFGDGAHAQSGTLRAVDFVFAKAQGDLFQAAHANSFKPKKTGLKRVLKL